MSRNLQPGIHPDSDQLSVFVEGAATVRERELMLAHLAECAACRKVVFLMQPQEEPQTAAITPEKGWASRGWTWRWLVPVGLPAAALACALIAVLIHFRPHGTTETPQQIASVRPPESEQPATMVAPNVSEQQSQSSVRSKASKRGRVPRSGQATPSVPSQTATAVVGGAIGGPVPTTNPTLEQNTVTTTTVSNLPLNGRNQVELQQLSPAPAGTQGAAAQGAVAKKKELPALQIQSASSEVQTLGGISGRITDRSGATIAGAVVTVRDAAGKTRQTTTGVDGSFYLTQLPAGQYRLTATANGFKTNNESIELKPSEMAMLQPVLDVGSVSETVEVTASEIAMQTESASVGSQVSPVPSDQQILATVSHGKRVLSLDDAGNLFLSRNEGKKWKKIKPRWTGKAIRIELTSGYVSEAMRKHKSETTDTMGEEAIFLLTTDSGTVWASKDGAHWHQ